LKTSQHETNLKHENFTVSTYIFCSYISVVIAKKTYQHHLMFTKVRFR